MNRSRFSLVAAALLIAGSLSAQPPASKSATKPAAPASVGAPTHVAAPTPVAAPTHVAAPTPVAMADTGAKSKKSARKHKKAAAMADSMKKHNGMAPAKKP